MGRKEDMVKLASQLMGNRDNIRNMGIVAHIDHGKCVDGKTRIMLAGGGVVTAAELFQLGVLNGERVLENANETVFAFNEPVMVFSVNKATGRIERKAVSLAWRLRGGKLVRLRLRNGFSIATTPEHQYLTFDGFSFGFRRASELRRGQRVVVARKLEASCDCCVEEKALRLLSSKPFYARLSKEAAVALRERVLGVGVSKVWVAINSNLRKRSFYRALCRGVLPLRELLGVVELFGLSVRHAFDWIECISLKGNPPMKLPRVWDSVFFVAGLMVGDGFGKKLVVGEGGLGEVFTRVCSDLGVKVHLGDCSGKTLEYATNRTFLMFLNALFDYPLKRKSRNVKISDFVSTAPKHLVAEFLRGYFDCEGTVDLARHFVSISSESRRMLSDLQMLLLRFGCVPITQGNMLCLSGESAVAFEREIGFTLKCKMECLRELNGRASESLVCDVVPCHGLKKVCGEINASKNSVGVHYCGYEGSKHLLNRRTFRAIQLTLSKRGLALLSVEDLAFIEIVGIEEEYAETVYDFTVDEHHNFVAEGVVVHNTTLTDNLIAAAGLISSELAGKQLFMDYYELEQQRGITINAANISLVHEYEGEQYLVNIIDTPGHVDFGGDVIRAMRAVDGVIVVVDAVEGVMPQTETVIRQALRENVKPVLFINKVDRLINELQLDERQMQERFVKTIAKVNMLIKKSAPDEYRESWLVNVESGSVAFGSAYYNWAVSVPQMKKTGIGFSDVYAHLEGDRQGELVEKSPLFQAILEMVINHLPNPVEAQRYRIPSIWMGELESEVGKAMLNCDENGPFAMMVTDVSVDPHAGDIATGRVYSGTMKPGVRVRLAVGKREVSVQQVGVFMGPERVTVEAVPAGNIACIVGLKEVFAGETISSIEMQPFESFKSSVEPVMTVSVEPKQTKDLPKLIEVIRQITKEDPNIVATLNQETGEHLISGMGELHLEVTQYRIEKDHGIPIEVSAPIVVFRETVTKGSPTLEGKSPNKHNKFKMSVKPIPREVLERLVDRKISGKIKPKDQAMVAAFEECGFSREIARKIWCVHNNNVLVDATRGIVALHEIRELVIQGFQDAMDEGPLAKEKCLGVMVFLEDAKLHEDAIHRGPAQVLPLTTRTIYACMLSAEPIFLEPKQILTINVPQDFMGAVTKELSARRTQITEMNQEGDTSIIIAKAPVKELIGFSADIRGATQGRAIWTAEYAGYEPLPRELQSEVIAEVRKRKGLGPEPKKAEYFLE